MFGSLEADDPMCYRIVSRLKILVYSINYRHTPEFTYPTQPNDVWDALTWAFDHLGSYGADLSNVVMGGISAGANLTAATAVMELDKNMKRIKGMLFCANYTGPPPPLQQFPSGILSETAESSYVQNAAAPVLNRSRVNFFFDNYKAPPESDRYFHVMKCTDAELQQMGIKKAYSMGCGLDPFRDEGIVWHERLTKAGKDTRIVLYPGLPHGLGLGYVKEDVFPPKHKWDDDYVEGVRWLLEK